MGEASTDSFAQHLAFGEDGEQRGHGATSRRGQVERLGQRHVADAEMLQFLQSREQVGYRSSLAVQTPHHNNVDLSSPCSFQQFLPTLPLYCSRANFFHLHGDGPAAPGSIFAHGAVLQGQRLLILCRDPGIEAGANYFGAFLPLAENPPGFCDAGPLLYGHFTKLPGHGRRLSFPAIRDSS
jgi:hypothetical protein